MVLDRADERRDPILRAIAWAQVRYLLKTGSEGWGLMLQVAEINPVYPFSGNRKIHNGR